MSYIIHYMTSKLGAILRAIWDKGWDMTDWHSADDEIVVNVELVFYAPDFECVMEITAYTADTGEIVEDGEPIVTSWHGVCWN